MVSAEEFNRILTGGGLDSAVDYVADVLQTENDAEISELSQQSLIYGEHDIYDRIMHEEQVGTYDDVVMLCRCDLL